MHTFHEGEIVVKEKYGSTFQRFYVKPPDQANLVLLDEEKSNSFTNLFKRIFLPHGYPESVSKDYINYQIWDTAQAFCSTITGTLATQEVLRGVGVGDTGATPLAATITWVLKDGCGHLGRIFFAYSHGTYLDAYSKKWRLYADTLNDAAMCMEIALPVFKNYTTFVLCISTMMKAIVGVAGGATRVAMTQHHAIRGNMADVAAKDSAQETAVNLIASITALLVITVFGNSFILFLMMIGLHIVFNYFAVRAVCLRTLNEPRFLQIIDTYLNQEVIANPCDINMNEPIVFYQLGTNILDIKLSGFKILLGQSINKLVRVNPKAFYVKNVQEVYKNQNYLLFPYIPDRKMYVVLRDVATTDDILCAYFHAVLLSIVICSLNDVPLAINRNTKTASRPFVEVCRTLQEAEWSKDLMENPSEKFKYEPSIELMSYLVDIVQKEWRLMRTGLHQIGWDIQKHLLVIDEWRISTPRLISRNRPAMDKISHDPKILSFDALQLKPKEDYDTETCTIEPEGFTDQADVKSVKTETEATNTSNIKLKVSESAILQTIPSNSKDTTFINPQVCQCVDSKSKTKKFFK